jgi:hypothetical protein
MSEHRHKRPREDDGRGTGRRPAFDPSFLVQEEQRNVVVPFAERMLLSLCRLAAELAAESRASDAAASDGAEDGGPAEEASSALLPSALARVQAEYEAALPAALGGVVAEGLLGKAVSESELVDRVAELNRRRAALAAAHLARAEELVEHGTPGDHADPRPHQATDGEGGPSKAGLRARLRAHMRVLAFARDHIQPHTGNALQCTAGDLAALAEAAAAAGDWEGPAGAEQARDDSGAPLVGWACERLAGLHGEGVLSYPWKRFSQLPPDTLMYNLRRYRDELTTERLVPHNVRFSSRLGREEELFALRYRGGYLGIVHRDEDYDAMDVLVDLFQEPQRLAARRQDTALSPLGLWAAAGVAARSLAAVARQHGRIDAYLLREELYGDGRRECTQFKPSLALAVMRHFRAARILDFSAGWGDRLAAAIAHKADKYTAFDPNAALRPGHAELVRRYVAEDLRRKFVVTYTGFEEARVADADYDLVFTSPPFFDFELYSSLPGQSVDRHPQLPEWLVRFLFVCLHKAWRALRAGGHMVIHITDVFKTKVCEPMCLFVQGHLPRARYLGVINSVGKAGRPRPMWVFQRTDGGAGGSGAGAAAAADPADARRAAAARAELQRLFPDIDRVLQTTDMAVRPG